MKGTYADTLQVWNSLSKQDQSYLGGRHIDSPALLFRKVEYDNGKPIGFIEIYDESKVDPKYGSSDRAIISVAVSPEYRKKGIGKKLMNDARQWFNNQSKFTKLEYSILNRNKASEHLIRSNSDFKTSRMETNKYHVYEIQKNVQESMGLASMNPMVGTNSNSGSYIVNVMNHDKDLGDTKNYTGLAKSLDVDSNLYGIDQNGKVQAKKRYDVMNQEDIVEVFKITSSNSEIIAESIIREAILPYDQRPIHGQNYIYEVFTKKPFMMHEQFYFEPILEKIELEKMSAGLAGVVTGNDRTMNMQHKGKKQSNYIPDNDYPSGTENLHYHEDSSILKDIRIGKHKIPYKCEIKNSYHSLDGIIKNPIPALILHSDKKQWRVRAELLLMKDDQIWLMKEDKPNHYGLTYKLPGGGIDDPDESIEDACTRECTEEILIVPKNVIYTGVDIKQIYPYVPEWHKLTLWKDNIKYDGSISFVCIGEYDKPYKGYVKKVDRSPDMVQKGKFYKYSEVKRIMHTKHREVIEKYLKERDYMK